MNHPDFEVALRDALAGLALGAFVACGPPDAAGPDVLDAGFDVAPIDCGHAPDVAPSPAVASVQCVGSSARTAPAACARTRRPQPTRSASRCHSTTPRAPRSSAPCRSDPYSSRRRAQARRALLSVMVSSDPTPLREGIPMGVRVLFVVKEIDGDEPLGALYVASLAG